MDKQVGITKERNKMNVILGQQRQQVTRVCERQRLNDMLRQACTHDTDKNTRHTHCTRTRAHT